jgi:hypothetical protein
VILKIVAAIFCSSCGAEANGRFCWRCGAQLHGQEGETSPSAVGGSSIAAASESDWPNDVRYQVLIGVPEVRDRIARQAALARKGMSAEQFLAAADKVMAPLMAVPIPLQPMAEFAQAVDSKLGIHTGRQRSEHLDWPAAR